MLQADSVGIIDMPVGGTNHATLREKFDAHELTLQGQPGLLHLIRQTIGPFIVTQFSNCVLLNPSWTPCK